MITSAVRANGIKGPVQITAFGDILQLSRTNQEALSSTGINIAHIPHGMPFSVFSWQVGFSLFFFFQNLLIVCTQDFMLHWTFPGVI